MPFHRPFSRLCFFAAALLIPLKFAAADRIIAPSHNPANHNPNVSLHFDDADIHSALKILAEVSDENIVFQRDVNGKVRSIQLTNVPASQAFETLLRMHGLYAVTEGNVTIVYPIEQFIRDAKARRQLNSM